MERWQKPDKDGCRWVEDSEYADGSGRKLYVKMYDLFSSFTYFPAENRAWFHDGISDHQAISIPCYSWDEAEDFYERFRGNAND